MAETHLRPSWFLLSVILFVGAIAACAALWLVDHFASVRNPGILIALLLGVFFVCWTWALISVLKWRVRRRPVTAVVATYRPELEGTVYGLVQGSEYRVTS